MKSGSIFYASDKALFDVLNQHKITNLALRQMFFSRGIVVSKDAGREELAKYFSRLTHDYIDHVAISKVFESSTRREKTTAVTIDGGVDLQVIEDVVHKLCGDISSYDDIAEMNTVKDGVEIRLKYKQIDYNKNEFRQVVDRVGSIVIEKCDEGWSIRNNLNDYVEDIKNQIIDGIENSIGEDLYVEEISLEHVEDNVIRTKFFTTLIESIDGFYLEDVTDAYAFHLKSVSDSDSSDDEDNEEDVSTGIHIKKASLKGEGVLKSDELRSLYSRGFYINKIVWKVSDGTYGSDLYELEAQFADPEKCNKFSYLVKGLYRHNGDSGHIKNRNQVSKAEELKFAKLLEAASRKAKETVLVGLGDGG
jgi:hypothetical protein